MESHHVDAIFLAFFKYGCPRCLVGRCVAGQGKAAVFDCSAHVDVMAVEIYLAVTRLDVTHSENGR